ncbi:MAG: CopG family transcriptional regulator [Methylobacterium mesophilicum]|nr:CopG family transcriptional regulator [Methylobacterium mesophilicum]
MKAADFDKAFDDGEDIDAFIDWSTMRRPNQERHLLEIELTGLMADSVGQQARSLGITPQALIQRWIAEKLS